MDIAQIVGEFWIQHAKDPYINMMHLFQYWRIWNFRNNGLSVSFTIWDKPPLSSSQQSVNPPDALISKPQTLLHKDCFDKLMIKL